MKVIQISFSELPTLQKHLYLLRTEMEKRGVDVWTIGSSNLKIETELTSHSILIDTPSTPNPSLKSLASEFGVLKDIVRQIKQINPEVIHFVSKHSWNYLLLLRLKGSLPNARFVHTFHDPIGHEGDSVQRKVILYNKLIKKRLDGIIVLSDIAQKQTVQMLRPRCLVYTVPFGEKYWNDYCPIRTIKHRVLIFGRLNSYKGVEFYPTIADLLKRFSPEATLVVAGMPSADISISIIEELKKRDNVELHARFIEESEVASFFDNCDLVLIPYKSITQSGVILDAYSRSRAVVAFDVDGVSQFVPDAEMRVPAYDCERMVRVICGILSKLEVLQAKSFDAWRYGKTYCSPEAMAKGVVDVYVRVCRVDGR